MSSGPADARADSVTKPSGRSVAETVARFVDLCRSRGLTVFAVIDQAGEARGVGLDLRETTLVLFGDPSAGTPVMQAEPLAALDLPLRVLVWDDAGQTKVSYPAPEALAKRYDLDPTLVTRLAGIHALTDALVT